MAGYIQCPVCENKRASDGCQCVHCGGMGMVPPNRMLRKVDKYELLLKFVREWAHTPLGDGDQSEAVYQSNLRIIDAQNLLRRIGEHYG